jgi:nucleotide-binding universal stress UspA family protein
VNRILVGLDGSPTSFAALQWASRVGWSMQLDVLAVSALDSLPSSRPAEPSAQPLTDRLDQMK